MMYLSKLSYPLILLFILFCGNSAFAQNWHRGNTHAHTSNSDGKMRPSDVVQAYKDEGYSFLFITDEDQITPIDSYSDSLFLCYTGEEAIFEQHISCLNIKTAIPPTNFIDVISATHEQGGFAVVNHPKRDNHIVDAYKVVTSDSIKYIEIFNGKSEKDGHYDDQSTWDSLLTAGKLIYGIAVDDFHEMKHISKGWIMVDADTLHRDSIINSIENGEFYSSSGIIISKLETTDSSIFIETTNANEISFIGNNRTVLQRDSGRRSYYKLTGNEGYIRVEAKNFGGKKAWTQPLYWNKTFVGLPERKPVSSVPRYSFPMQLYPNPTKGIINFAWVQNQDQANCQIINFSGITVLSGRINLKTGIDVSRLPEGIYILKVSTPAFSSCYRFLKI